MPEDLSTHKKSLKQLEKEKNKQLKDKNYDKKMAVMYNNILQIVIKSRFVSGLFTF